MCPVQTVTYVSGLVTSVLHDRSSTMFWVLHERLVSGLLLIRRPRSHCRVTVSRSPDQVDNFFVCERECYPHLRFAIVMGRREIEQERRQLSTSRM